MFNVNTSTIMKNQLTIAIRALLFFTALTGVAYPLLVTGIAQLAFRDRANGSIVMQNGVAVGSRLIGQAFTSDTYFWGRPSAVGYDARLSGASNLGPTSAKLDSMARANRRSYVAVNSIGPNTPIPAEMIFASASGLDPHISVDAALQQLPRVAAARSFNARKTEAVRAYILKSNADRTINPYQRPIVNVLELNLYINQLQ